MKKVLMVMLALFLVFAVACGPVTAPEDETEAAKETDPVVEETDVPEETENETDPVIEETEVLDETENTIELGKAIVFDEFEITITELKVVKNWEGGHGLRISYDWTNTGDEGTMASLTFSMKGFQDDVETSGYVVMSDDVDFEPGQKVVKPGGVITGAHDAVPIDDMAKPLLLELTELFSWDDTAYIYQIDDLSKYE